MNTRKLQARLGGFHWKRAKSLQHSDIVRQRLISYVSRHSVERRLEAYTIGRGRISR